MSMTDPIADMLTRVRNANLRQHDDVSMPSSKVKVALADVLQKAGYVNGYTVEDEPGRPSKILTIELKYDDERRRTISGIRRVSKPGLRVYSKAHEVPRVLGGMGIAVLSTSVGLLTDGEARKRNVGGEVLCQVW
ncbi:MAG: 30S ribosomal protein S8 [Acidimicrobiia bacterium]